MINEFEFYYKKTNKELTDISLKKYKIKDFLIDTIKKCPDDSLLPMLYMYLNNIEKQINKINIILNAN